MLPFNYGTLYVGDYGQSKSLQGGICKKFPLQSIVYCCSCRERFPRVDIKLHLHLALTGISANST